MTKKECLLLKEVLSAADDLADLMCEGMDIEIEGGGYRDRDKTIEIINKGHDVINRYLKFHISMDDPKLYEVNEDVIVKRRENLTGETAQCESVAPTK
jgi:hypothetical protein